ncbi:MAG: alpha/beta hydrolase fold domain-containing protein [Candidatus Zipacnadales bacterium]
MSGLLCVVSAFSCGIWMIGRAESQPSYSDLLQRFDRNGDGQLSREEFPVRGQQLFDRIDANKDGFVTAEEDQAFRRMRQSPGQQQPSPLPNPEFANVPYGEHERNVFDLWQAKSETPTPLVIYYHGGGFRGGDKRTLRRDFLEGLLQAGISVAAVNYRLTDTAPFPAPMHDAARALQFIRHHAQEYHIDPTRVGATGGSAGAGISQWLAFHDDLADPESEDPVARESTRLTCAVVYAAQSTYDPREHMKMFNTTQVDPAMLPFYGMNGPEEVNDPRFHPLFEEASPINHATADDPPVMLFYPQPNQPVPPNSPGSVYIHHPQFGLLLKEKLDELGVECVLILREDLSPEEGRGEPIGRYIEFFREKLGVAGNAAG